MCKRRAQVKNVLHTGFSLEDVGYDDYYGFVLDRDHLYLLDDFTVTHNSGKTSAIWQMTAELVQRQNGIVVFVEEPELSLICIHMLRRIEPSRPLICIFEDIDALVQRYGDHGYLALLDGEVQIDNVIHVACPAPETRILKADLTWRRADSLSAGDEIIGFDENGPDRKWRTATVNSCPIIEKPRYRVFHLS